MTTRIDIYYNSRIVHCTKQWAIRFFNAFRFSNHSRLGNPKAVSFVFLLLFSLACQAQTIVMEFPAFAGKTFDFVIFQGDKTIKIYENDTIPPNGIISLVIPNEYAPYTGMCRWLITNTDEGGGLDMAVPGYGFIVTCLSQQPSINNIQWHGHDAMNELNRLYKEQQLIIDKFETISKATQLYGVKHPLHIPLNTEKKTLQTKYIAFRQALKKNSNHNARLLPILSLLYGIPHKLTDKNDEKAKFTNEYMVNELDYNDLYTSGHWTNIIQSWVQMHTQMTTNKDQFVKDFTSIHLRITDPKKYTDWVDKVTYSLTKYTKDEYIEAIAPIVINSGKVSSYEGKTMQIYITARIGSQAPDLEIPAPANLQSDKQPETTYIKTNQLESLYTLLVFYKSDCGPCEATIKELIQNYPLLKEKGFRVIAISADENETIFTNKASQFPWKDTYCDLKGAQGPNFTKYAILGTPTLYVLDSKGVIIDKPATVEQLIK